MEAVAFTSVPSPEQRWRSTPTTQPLERTPELPDKWLMPSREGEIENSGVYIRVAGAVLPEDEQSGYVQSIVFASPLGNTFGVLVGDGEGDQREAARVACDAVATYLGRVPFRTTLHEAHASIRSALDGADAAVRAYNTASKAAVFASGVFGRLYKAADGFVGLVIGSVGKESALACNPAHKKGQPQFLTEAQMAVPWSPEKQERFADAHWLGNLPEEEWDDFLHSWGNISQAFGYPLTLEEDVQQTIGRIAWYDPVPGDRIVLCSGVSDPLTREEMGEILLRDRDMSRAAAELVIAASEKLVKERKCRSIFRGTEEPRAAATICLKEKLRLPSAA